MKQAPPAFVDRAAIGNTLDHGAPIHRLKIEVHPKPAQQIAADLAEGCVVVDVGRHQQRDFFAVIASIRNGALGSRQVVGHRHGRDAGGFGDIGRAAGEIRPARAPRIGAVAGAGEHEVRLLRGGQNRTAQLDVVERRLQMIEAQDADPAERVLRFQT